jgi:hypothetical protein
MARKKQKVEEGMGGEGSDALFRETNSDDLVIDDDMKIDNNGNNIDFSNLFSNFTNTNAGSSALLTTEAADLAGFGGGDNSSASGGGNTDSSGFTTSSSNVDAAAEGRQEKKESIAIHVCVLREELLRAFNAKEKHQKNPIPLARMIFIVNNETQAEFVDGAKIEEQILVGEDNDVVVGIKNFPDLVWETMVEPFNLLAQGWGSKNDEQQRLSLERKLSTSKQLKWLRTGEDSAVEVCSKLVQQMCMGEDHDDHPDSDSWRIVPFFSHYWPQVDAYSCEDWTIAWWQHHGACSAAGLHMYTGQIVAAVMMGFGGLDADNLKKQTKYELIDSLLHLLEIFMSIPANPEIWYTPRTEDGTPLTDMIDVGPAWAAGLNFYRDFLRTSPPRMSRFFDVVIDAFNTVKSVSPSDPSKISVDLNSSLIFEFVCGLDISGAVGDNWDAICHEAADDRKHIEEMLAKKRGELAKAQEELAGCQRYVNQYEGKALLCEANEGLVRGEDKAKVKALYIKHKSLTQNR